MAGATAALGADVSIVTTDADGRGRIDAPIDEWFVERGVRIRVFRHAAFASGWHFSWGLTRWLARTVRDFDVVEAHGLFTYTTIPACRFAARSGVPYVLRPLGTLAGWSLAQHAWKKRPYYTLVEKRHLLAAAAIHVTAESEAEEVRRLGFGDKVRVIPLGVELGPSGRELRSERGLRLLFLSRVHPKKGLELVFAALALVRERGSLDGVTLAIAGDGDSDYLHFLRTEMAARALEDVVSFVGPLHAAAKSAAFGSADAFILTSHNENFGIAAAEALAHGLPVILSSEVGLASEVAASDAGLVVPLNASSIASAIEALRDNPTGRQAMGARAWQLADNSLSWEQCGKRLIALYKEVASSRREFAIDRDRSRR